MPCNSYLITRTDSALNTENILSVFWCVFHGGPEKVITIKTAEHSYCQCTDIKCTDIIRKLN